MPGESFSRSSLQVRAFAGQDSRTRASFFIRTTHSWYRLASLGRLHDALGGGSSRFLTATKSEYIVSAHWRPIRGSRTVPDLGQISARGVEKETNVLCCDHSPCNRCSTRYAEADRLR